MQTTALFYANVRSAFSDPRHRKNICPLGRDGVRSFRRILPTARFQEEHTNRAADSRASRPRKIRNAAKSSEAGNSTVEAMNRWRSSNDNASAIPYTTWLSSIRRMNSRACCGGSYRRGHSSGCAALSNLDFPSLYTQVRHIHVSHIASACFIPLATLCRLLSDIYERTANDIATARLESRLQLPLCMTSGMECSVTPSRMSGAGWG